MNINIDVNGSLTPQIIDDGISVGDFLRRPAIKAHLGLPEQYNPVVNNRQVPNTHLLQNGDTVSYQPIASSKAVKSGKKEKPAKGGKKSK